MKWNKETDEDGKKKRENVEVSKGGTKKGSPDNITIARAYRPPEVDTPRSSGRIN